ncbi:MAG: radical SAM protein [Sedimentisphaerales bacterium]
MINISKLYCGIENSSDDFRYHSDNGKGPVVVYNCTNKCSQNCLHCYNKTEFSNGKELDTLQAKELLKQLKRIKCPVVLFSGGEPLERNDLFELLDFSRSIGLRTALSTSGNLIDFKIAKKLVSIGVNYVGISVDGTEETHDKFRGVSGSFMAAVNAVKFCKDVNLKTGLRFTITNLNFNQIRDIFFLAARLNIQRICFYHLISAGNAAKNNLKCTNQQIRQALNDICNCAQHYIKKGVTEVLTVGNHADGVFILNRLKRENSPLYQESFDLLQKFGGNKIGVKIFAIDPAGNVHPDQFWQNFSLGNIAESNFENILNNSINIFKNKIPFAPQKCKKCKWLNLCGSNARFTGDDFKSKWFLEPDCYLNDEEMSVTGVSNAEFACQNTKA